MAITKLNESLSINKPEKSNKISVNELTKIKKFLQDPASPFTVKKRIFSVIKRCAKEENEEAINSKVLKDGEKMRLYSFFDVKPIESNESTINDPAIQCLNELIGTCKAGDYYAFLLINPSHLPPLNKDEVYFDTNGFLRDDVIEHVREEVSKESEEFEELKKEIRHNITRISTKDELKADQVETSFNKFLEALNEENKTALKESLKSKSKPTGLSAGWARLTGKCMGEKTGEQLADDISKEGLATTPNTFRSKNIHS